MVSKTVQADAIKGDLVFSQQHPDIARKRDAYTNIGAQ